MTLSFAGGSLVLGRLHSGGWQTGSDGGEGRSGEMQMKTSVTEACQYKELSLRHNSVYIYVADQQTRLNTLTSYHTSNYKVFEEKADMF